MQWIFCVLAPKQGVETSGQPFYFQASCLSLEKCSLIMSELMDKFLYFFWHFCLLLTVKTTVIFQQHRVKLVISFQNAQQNQLSCIKVILTTTHESAIHIFIMSYELKDHNFSCYF